MSILLIVMGILFIYITGAFLMIPWFVYRDMTKDDCNLCYKATYEEFKGRFDSIVWKVDPCWSNSLFGAGDSAHREDNYLHASIIRMGNVGYLMNVIDYIRARMLIKSKIKELTPPKYTIINKLPE